MARPIAPNPAVGLWKLNLAKSSFRLVPIPSVLKIEPREDGLKVSADTIDAKGTNLHPAVVYKFDGKNYPLVGTPVADTVSAKRINELISEGTWKRDGKVVLTIRITVSEDGKTLTMTRTEADSQARSGDDVMVYDRHQSGG
jgi:hypothetical protein